MKVHGWQTITGLCQNTNTNTNTNANTNTNNTKSKIKQLMKCGYIALIIMKFTDLLTNV